MSITVVYYVVIPLAAIVTSVLCVFLGFALGRRAHAHQTINLQETEITVRDRAIADLTTAFDEYKLQAAKELQTYKDATAHEMAGLRGEIEQLRATVAQNAIDKVAKDSAIALSLRRANALEAKLKRYDQLRASCPNLTTCPLERRRAQSNAPTPLTRKVSP